MILLTVYRRPAYTKQVLDALAECYGIGEYSILVSADTYAENPALTQACVDLARNFKASKDVRINVHNPKLGIDSNKLWAFPHAFKESDCVIHLEDDCIPAKDALRFLEWGEALRDDPSILSVSAYQKEGVIIDAGSAPHIQRVHGMYDAFRGRGGFACWAWATWKDRWQQVIGDESQYRAFAGEQVDGRFDWWWKKYMEEHGMCQVHPFVSRCQNLVGEPDTENAGENSNDEFAMNNFNPEGVWQLDNIPDPSIGVWRLT